MPAKKTTAKKATKKTSEKKYDLVVKVNDTKLNAKTNDFEKALLDLELGFIKTPVKIELSKGSKKVERVIFPPQARAIFYKDDRIKSLAKDLNLLING